MSYGILIFILATIGVHIGLYGMFKKAGLEPWKALVPFYNTWVMVEHMPLKKYWFFLQFIPIAGQFITIWIFIKFVEHFGRFSILDHAATVLIPFLYLPYLGFSKDTRYPGHEAVKNYKKSGLREWVDAAVFAIVAASIIRTFVFEAYTIPTGSMEKTLLINDFLFVSKLSYGPRLPNTPLAVPFVHHTLPVSNSKSYLEWIKIPYKRIFPSEVKRNDVVVFNYPVGDTVVGEFQSERNYYDLVRFDAAGDRNLVLQRDDIMVRPVDKRENFIKRCVAVAGDTLEVRNGRVYINGKAGEVPPHSANYYYVETDGTMPDAEALLDQGIDLTQNERHMQPAGPTANVYRIDLTDEEKSKMEKLSFVRKITPEIFPFNYTVFPFDTAYHRWSEDNYGPIWIPKKGATVTLTRENIEFFRRVIMVYENNTLEENNGQFVINGQATNQYTFKMNYFWMMGDNRHDSQDSRFWGYVPEDHVVGKASLIWFSWNKGPRWNRLFRSIK